MPNGNHRLDVECNRSKFAFAHRTHTDSPNYDAMVKKLPAYIQTNGLVYTLAFLHKKDPGLYDTLWKWHCNATDNFNQLTSLASKSKEAFLRVVVNDLEDDEIRRLTMETLALLNWLKRFVTEDEASQTPETNGEN